MKISAACAPPMQPPVTKAERSHKRFWQYSAYRASCTRQLVTAMSFAAWLASTERHENGHEVVYEVKAGAKLRPGWYKNKFGPEEMRPTRFGPFLTEMEAVKS